MTNIYVIDPNTLAQIDVIDEYTSVIWRPSYSDIGDFELYLPATEKVLGLLVKDRYLVRETDITTDVFGGTVYKNVMIIKNLSLTTDVENGDYVTVTGKELKCILNQRIIWGMQILSYNSVEAALLGLVQLQAIAPANSARVIPRLAIINNRIQGEPIQKQISYEQLGAAIVDMCNTYNYGWEIYINVNPALGNGADDDGSRLIFEVYEGVDRSYNQTERSFVVFSDEYENLNNTEYQLSTEEYANVTLVGGEGEGADRFLRTVGAASGLARYETFTDAKDISKNAGESTLSDAEYNALLDEKGREKLASLAYTEGFSGEVLSDVTFKYKEDFYLGDIVTVINKYGISRNVRVLSAIESEDENGSKLVPQFNM